MKNGFDMYNQTFEYTRLKHSPPKLSNRTMINHNIEDVKKFNLDYISIKDTNLEHVKEIHGYSVQKFENKVVFAEINIPLVADIHFDWNLAIQAINYGADKIRINPGNLEKTKLKLVVESAKKRKIPIRIGVNGGSLPKDILKKYGDRVTPEGLVESVENSINLIQEMDFFDIVVSMKSSDVLMTIEAHKILSQKGDWPLHIGVTEAGHALSGTVKSSLGIGALLLAGIGDTIRVSLTGDPQNEVKAAWEILKSLHIRERGLSIVSCPTCARTKIPVEKIVSYLERFSEEFSSKPIKIAVMGCIVNGLGEAKEADMAFVGLENKKIAFFRKGKFVANFDPEDVFDSIDKIMTEKNY